MRLFGAHTVVVRVCTNPIAGRLAKFPLPSVLFSAQRSQTVMPMFFRCSTHTDTPTDRHSLCTSQTHMHGL